MLFAEICARDAEQSARGDPRVCVHTSGVNVHAWALSRLGGNGEVGGVWQPASNAAEAASKMIRQKNLSNKVRPPPFPPELRGPFCTFQRWKVHNGLFAPGAAWRPVGRQGQPGTRAV